MYKIFRVTYNDGGWHSGDLPNFYYIAKSEEEVIANSKKYQEYLDWQMSIGGDVWIREVSRAVGSGGVVGLTYSFYFENLEGFDIEMSVRKKD